MARQNDEKLSAEAVWLAINQLIDVAASLTTGEELAPQLSANEMEALGRLVKEGREIPHRAFEAGSKGSTYGPMIKGLYEIFERICSNKPDQKLSRDAAVREIEQLMGQSQELAPGTIRASSLYRTPDQISEDNGPLESSIKTLAGYLGYAERTLWYHWKKYRVQSGRPGRYSVVEITLLKMLEQIVGFNEEEAELVARILAEYIRAKKKDETSNFVVFLGQVLGQLATSTDARSHFFGEK